jgi:nucleotide-binding universal stress UspA family protein
MPTIKHILFPFDFSQQAFQAAPFVREIASRLGARVTLLSVLPPAWDFPVLGVAIVASGDHGMEGELKSRLDQTLTNELAGELGGIPVECRTSRGDPALKITDFVDDAANGGVDLIMMATHGTGMFRHLLIGSVAAKVLHDAQCPVWTATHAEEQRSPKVPRTILCAVDATPEATILMQWSVEFAQRMGAALKLLHVVPPVSDWLALPAERGLQEQAREAARAKIDALRRSAGIEAGARIAVGPIADTVAEDARQEAADLIVIGRGSHTQRIVQMSTCPVLSV